MYELRFHSDPTEFLAVAGTYLTENPITGSVVSSITDRSTPGEAHLGEGVPRWWVSVHGVDDRVISVAMRTAPFEPYPPFLMDMPREAAHALARVLHERDEPVGGVNGALSASREFASEYARLVVGEVRTLMQMRLFEATSVEMPKVPDGLLRLARVEEADLVDEWCVAFHRDAEEQGGRDPDGGHGIVWGDDELQERIQAGEFWLFETADGEVVHLTGRKPPSFGVSRIGPVYTPPQHRGRGYASYVVAELTRTALAAGIRMCLYTDQANPTSNAIYQRLGYRALVDEVNLRIDG